MQPRRGSVNLHCHRVTCTAALMGEGGQAKVFACVVMGTCDFRPSCGCCLHDCNLWMMLEWSTDLTDLLNFAALQAFITSVLVSNTKLRLQNWSQMVVGCSTASVLGLGVCPDAMLGINQG